MQRAGGGGGGTVAHFFEAGDEEGDLDPQGGEVVLEQVDHRHHLLSTNSHTLSFSFKAPDLMIV